jgi:hypothetical protein
MVTLTAAASAMENAATRIRCFEDGVGDIDQEDNTLKELPF